MTGDPLEPGAFSHQLLDHVPGIQELAEVETRIVFNLDSSDVGPIHWAELAAIIGEEQDDWDGFVVIHGTDTMAYTAGALAFALKNLHKPVILTGAQRPMAAVRTDARRNLLDAVEVATLDIPEVGICFDGLLLRGCRSVKNDARSYRAFASPGVEPLARLGTDVNVRADLWQPRGPFRCDPRFDEAVDVLYVAPGIHADWMLARLDDSALKGVVLAAFGVGTVPRLGGLVEAVARAVARGVDVLVVTQWGGRVDLDAYRNSQALHHAGALSGGQMRIEAAVPKLMHALAAYPDPAARRTYLLRDEAGERG
jgi:L-asparaginase